MYLFLGGVSSVASAPTRTYSGDQDEQSFGIVHPAWGDYNGDGRGDVALGDPTWWPAPRVLVYLGETGGLGATPHRVLSGPAGQFFGWSVARLDAFAPAPNTRAACERARLCCFG